MKRETKIGTYRKNQKGFGFVKIEEQEDDGEPFQEKMERLTGELSELFAKSHELEAEIKKQLASIGFTIK